MVKVGKLNDLKVVKKVEFGYYLDGDGEEILLPKRYAPKNLKIDDIISVFIYHDNEQRLIATTENPHAMVGEIAFLEVADTTPHGAFMEWGIMKQVFVPLALQETRMRIGNYRFVYLFIDEMTGRITASEKIDKILTNNEITVKENEPVDMLVLKKTDLGYKMIVNSLHIGLLHFDDVFKNLEIGERAKGFVKNIRSDNKIDLAFGARGYTKVIEEEDNILLALRENNGYLPFNDKSESEDIYAEFGISKKTFKKVIGALYKKHLVELTETGIKLIEE